MNVDDRKILIIAAFIVVIAMIMFIFSCDNVKFGQEQIPAKHEHAWQNYPVKIYISNETSKCQQAAVVAGVAYFETLANKNLADVFIVDKSSDKIIVGPGFGEVVVKNGPMDRADVLDQVEWTFMKGNDFLLYNAIMTVQGCSGRAMAHEVGHVFGFGHAHGDQMLMEKVHHPDAWNVDVSEYIEL
jgi:hypothetical protein